MNSSLSNIRFEPAFRAGTCGFIFIKSFLCPVWFVGKDTELDGCMVSHVESNGQSECGEK